MNNNRIPGLRKLYILQSATNNENVNLGVYPESDLETTAFPDLFTVKCPFRILGITKVQKKYHKVELGVGVHEEPI